MSLFILVKKNENEVPKGLYLMEQRQCLVLQLILQLMQFLFVTIQVQKVDIDCVTIGEHIRRK